MSLRWASYGAGRSRAALASLATLLALPCSAASWSFQVAVGFPFDLPMPLTIRQRGEPTLEVRARYDARPFQSPLYYDVRVSRRSGGSEWSLDLLHHKLHLENRPAEVQEFSISHGYNLVVLSHARELARGTWARAGGGAVVAHPENTIRGRPVPPGGPFGAGYHLAGAVVAGGLEQRLVPGDGPVFVSLQGLATLAWARVPVAGGTATAPDAALHALLGVGAASRAPAR
jgi:hypothetical protein